MELLNPLIPNRPVIEPLFSFFTPKFPIRSCNGKNPYKFQIRSYKLHGNSSVPIHLSFSSARHMHVSAQFGRPTRRRNSLRKKVIDNQVRPKNPISLHPNSEIPNPNPQFDNSSNTSTRENSDNDCLKDSNSSYGFGVDNDLVETESAKSWKTKSKNVGESALSTKLEKWVDQYNTDTAFWGLGSGHIFTVFHDLEGIVKRVLVHEDEILKRIQVEKQELDDPTELNSKILYAKGLAGEMERGENVIPRNSSVAKFILYDEGSGFVKAIRDVAFRPEIIPVVSGFGKMIFCGFVAIWALKKLFTFANKEQQLTELEKEMMRRKIKSRKDKEILDSTVEVIQEPELPMMSTEKPKLDKQELMRNILEAKASKDKLLLMNSSSSQTTGSMNLDRKIQQIRKMAWEVREIENGEAPIGNNNREEKQLMNDELSSGVEKFEKNTGEFVSFVGDIRNGNSGQRRDIDGTGVKMFLDKSKDDDTGCVHEVFPEKSSGTQSSSTSSVEIPKDKQIMARGEVNYSSDTPDSNLDMSNHRFVAMKPRLIRSVKEAREFLAKRGKKHTQELPIDTVQKNATVVSPPSDKEYGGKISLRIATDEQVLEPVALSRMSDTLPATDIYEESIPKTKEFVSTKNDDSGDSEEGHDAPDLQKPQKLLSSHLDRNKERRQPVDEKWMEKNFLAVEPIIKKIGDGFRDNYNIARQRVNENAGTVVTRFEYNEDDSELEWMKDDDLREIVFQVRENELSGRDPFYLMDAEDKAKFFTGLEKKVEKENENLLQVHEYLHSNIENLDYGADGISLYDPPEKFIPHWKGPVLEKNPEFLNNFLEQRKAIFAGTSYLDNEDERNSSQNSTEFLVKENDVPSLSNNTSGKNLGNKNPKDSKTVIEGSDGSVRAGKRSGKEYWQHTKKWSRGFLESYNAEADPEIKSIMKDMGKDLDRWITEEEIQEAADLMKKLPVRNKKFMEKKINKIKREMELFGPQAVVSKYREYAEEKGEDYLWWLDLPHVLCIELYTTQNGEQKVGFYSLEMAADLELEPKPCHVIAFEDACDCKNLCYIIQAHLDMLGNGQAFVVPRPPKDAFREAKANGFGVTVIRKRELELNVDQTLEEVEEQITEIGSKMYHDKLMKERSVDMSALMKGVFGFKSRTANTKRKKSKRTLKKPRKK